MTHKASTDQRDFADLLAEDWKDPEFLFTVKKSDVAVDLTAAIHHAGVTRAELSRRLKWKPSRVSRALSGRENLTLRTIFEILQATGWELDVIPRRASERPALRPWEREAVTVDLLDLRTTFTNHVEQAKKMVARAQATADECDAMRNTLRAAVRRAFLREWTQYPGITCVMRAEPSANQGEMSDAANCLAA